MNHYENVVISNANLSNEDYEKLKKQIENIIKKYGKLENAEEKGTKRLAYEIQNQNKGTYTIFEFSSKHELIDELERFYRLKDDVLKFIIVKKD